MELGRILVFLHVLFAIVGAGGMVAMYPLLIGASMSDRLDLLTSNLRSANIIDHLIVTPGFLGIGIFGAWVSFERNWDWDWNKNEWLIMGAGLYVLIFATGIFFQGPSLRKQLRRANEALEAGETEIPEDLARAVKNPVLMIVSMVALAILITIVEFMSYKPFVG